MGACGLSVNLVHGGGSRLPGGEGPPGTNRGGEPNKKVGRGIKPVHKKYQHSQGSRAQKGGGALLWRAKSESTATQKTQGRQEPRGGALSSQNLSWRPRGNNKGKLSREESPWSESHGGCSRVSGFPSQGEDRAHGRSMGGSG